MKKSVAFLIAFCMISAFALTSCNEKGGGNSVSSGVASVEGDKTSSVSASSEAESEKESSQNSTSSKEQGETSSKTSTSSKPKFEITTTSANLRDELSSKKPDNTTTTSSKNNTTTSSKKETATSSKAPVTNAKHDAITEDKYYGWLELQKSGTEAEKKAYKLFAEKFGAYETNIDFDFDITRDEVERAYNYYMDDYPQHFWRGNTRNYTFIGTKMLTITLTNALYGGDKAKIKEMEDKVNAQLDKILSGVKSSMTDFEVEVYIHNYLVNNCKYDTTYKAENAHNMYGALVNGVAVCEGYAYAFQHLCRLAGIQSIVVKGELKTDSKTESHAWNMVELEGKYYHIDVTSDDPVMNGGTKQVLEFTYFNLTDSQIKASHVIKDNTQSIPVANATKYNYFDYLGLRFSSVSVDNFAKALALAAEKKYEQAPMSFTSWDYSALTSFLSKNYYEIIEKANKKLGKEVISASGGISFTYNESHKMLSLKIVYK